VTVASVEYDPKAFNVTFICNCCKEEAGDPDKIDHIETCSIAVEQRESFEVKRLAGIIAKVFRDEAMNATDIHNWCGFMSLASSIREELNKECHVNRDQALP
jgi:hypothetical protein